ncbi:hypothetical protein [Oceanospirillum beijerinckii]|uniref:hypothetical protein n=1 Tax=Oceanospirillum beijerinckii TaxID=64976 RepID=UPI0004135C51|nr:hypothetical protein [Oceanospirillum beijerinckii]
MALMSIEDAAKELKFPGGRNGLYKFLRKHSEFQGTVPPYHLCQINKFFARVDSHYMRGERMIPTQLTKVTNDGMTYIAQLMSEHLPKPEKEKE